MCFLMKRGIKEEYTSRKNQVLLGFLFSYKFSAFFFGSYFLVYRYTSSWPLIVRRNERDTLFHDIYSGKCFVMASLLWDINWAFIALFFQVMECSAKTNSNIREIFKTFLTLAKIPVPSDDCSLRRRSSAHASVSKTRSNTPNTLSPGVHLQGSFFESNDQATASDVNSTSSATTTLSNHISINASRLKPRSRSLIRRTSKKVNKVKDPNSDPEDCIVSWSLVPKSYLEEDKSCQIHHQRKRHSTNP